MIGSASRTCHCRLHFVAFFSTSPHIGIVSIHSLILAQVGYLVNKAGIYLPGDINYSGTKFSDLGSGWDASFGVGKQGALQILGFVAWLEIAFMKDVGVGEFPGDFRNGAIDFGWDSFDEATKLRKRAIELNQGRAAMMGMLGLMVHDKLGNVDLLIPDI